MSYEDRLEKCEEEKCRLMESGIFPLEYERAIIELARKWKV